MRLDPGLSHKSAIASEAIERTANRYAIESEVSRQGSRQASRDPPVRAPLLFDDLRTWLERSRPPCPGSRRRQSPFRALALEGPQPLCRHRSASRSTTTSANGRCARSVSGGRTTCSPPTLAKSSRSNGQLSPLRRQLGGTRVHCDVKSVRICRIGG